MKLPTLLLVAALFGGLVALKVKINKEQTHLHLDEDLMVRCIADGPITHCQLRVGEDSPVDLSGGRQSSVNGFVYEGSGLRAGHCGANISAAMLPGWGTRGYIQCRVRSARSDWIYASMSVFISAWAAIPMSTASRSLVVPPSGTLSIVFQAETRLTYCELVRSQQRGVRDLPHYPGCDDRTANICYLDWVPGSTRCGVTIRNTTDNFNGLLWFQMRTPLGLELYHVQVIVTKPPTAPVLTVNTTRRAGGATTVRAVCSVSGGRPAANISWTLGGETVAAGDVVSLPDDRWVRPYEEQTTTQQLTLNLGGSSGHRELSCVAHHVALTSPLVSNSVKIT